MAEAVCLSTAILVLHVAVFWQYKHLKSELLGGLGRCAGCVQTYFFSLASRVAGISDELKL
jgi:hypothetical protein